MKPPPRLTAEGYDRIRSLIDRYDLTRYTEVPIKTVAMNEGWEVRYQPGLAPAFAFAVVHEGVKVMVVNDDISRWGQYAAIAHEVCHHLFEHQLGLDVFIARASPQMAQLLTDGLRVRQEHEANLGAALLLIQEHVVIECDYDIEQVAGMAGVPRQLAELRVGAMIYGEARPRQGDRQQGRVSA